jgi:hypothetical protein
MLTNMKRVLAAIILICLAGAAHGDEYATLAQGLRDSSAKVNKMKFPELMYRLDEETAHGYFRKYFSENRMTFALSVNLGYPLESWGNNHANLQKALAPVLIDEVGAFFTEYNMPSAISAALSADLALHDHLFFSLTHLSRIARSNKLSKEDMAAIGRRLFTVVKLSKLSDPRSRTIDPEKYPYVNSVKIQLLLACFSFAERGGNMAEFVRAARIGGPRGQLLAQTGVFAVDNGWFDAGQIQRPRKEHQENHGQVIEQEENPLSTMALQRAETPLQHVVPDSKAQEFTSRRFVRRDCPRKEQGHAEKDGYDQAGQNGPLPHLAKTRDPDRERSQYGDREADRTLRQLCSPKCESQQQRCPQGTGTERQVVKREKRSRDPGHEDRVGRGGGATHQHERSGHEHAGGKEAGVKADALRSEALCAA